MDSPPVLVSKMPRKASLVTPEAPVSTGRVYGFLYSSMFPIVFLYSLHILAQARNGMDGSGGAWDMKPFVGFLIAVAMATPFLRIFVFGSILWNGA
jgi:hypothetical protein